MKREEERKYSTLHTLYDAFSRMIFSLDIFGVYYDMCRTYTVSTKYVHTVPTYGSTVFLARRSLYRQRALSLEENLLVAKH
jgi:hypothetical protein